MLGDEGTQRRHASLYWEFNEKSGPYQAVRAGDWKAIRSLAGAGSFELYDLRNDIGETTNLAATRPDVVRRMRQLLERSRDEHPEFVLTARRKANNSR